MANKKVNEKIMDAESRKFIGRKRKRSQESEFPREEKLERIEYEEKINGRKEHHVCNGKRRTEPREEIKQERKGTTRNARLWLSEKWWEGRGEGKRRGKKKLALPYSVSPCLDTPNSYVLNPVSQPRKK